MKSTAEKHNNGIEFNTPFSNWSARRGVARWFATDQKTTHGVLITVKVRTFRIFRSPDKFPSVDLDRGIKTSREYEFLVVGPVQGIVSPER